LRKKVCKQFLVILSVVLIIIGCDYKPSSFGDFQKIIVFSDSVLYREIQTELEQTFDQFIYTPHLERSFILDLQPLRTFDTYKTRRNLLFVGLLNEDDKVSAFINSSLSEQTKQSVTEGRVFEIFKEDLFSTGQTVMFFPGTDIENLKKNLSDRDEIIFNKLNKFYFKRLEKAMYFKGEQYDLEDYLATKYGWKIRVQHDYELVKESDDEKFLWFRRLNPDRNLFILQFPANKFKDDGQWLYQFRDSLTTVFYEADSIAQEDTYLQYVDFLGRKAIKLTGVWQNHQHLIGGPFRTYAFTDDTRQYAYIIDLSVTAPGKRKKTFLDQLEVMAHTFSFVSGK
jgi:hypothetical protein